VLAEQFPVFRRFLDRLERPDPAHCGLDRDSGLVADAFDERDPAVRHAAAGDQACRKAGKYVGICGRSVRPPDFAKWLVGGGIESLSLNPDTVVDTLAAARAGTVPGRPKAKVAVDYSRAALACA